MKLYQFEDFCEKDAWLIFRVDTQVQHQPVDIYMVMDLPSGMIIAQEVIEDEMSQLQVDALFRAAKIKKGNMPCRMMITKGDPAEIHLKSLAQDLKIGFESVPAPYLEALVTPFKQSFGKEFFSPSTMGYIESDDSLEAQEAAKMIPDSYDPCHCASGKKYKFCCKRIFRETVEAMVAAEDGQFLKALEWINKAKAIVGETAEVLCREAIIYSYVDVNKSQECLKKCLTANPNHPRAHYLRGIQCKAEGDFSGAVMAYETAIANYPVSDHYHLNEAYNNLGTAFYAKGDLINAKSAWEKALLFMPSDNIARRNLTEFIHNNRSMKQ